ncbi:SMP-30/gluconolactonase/LRE family protein [Salinimonas marina]|uniref:SMP-30/gluconolactonase/LRE family protein n=1 Tax=Salinimonas marina TaxID=2785918 RepID=A0A7S9DZZ2_9ALTE|nr:L-dopachrome tautomerase-related protein [Salinimonas marina]QPG07048.1 SMP-30/gluconolactonase/LRE family protein [Salinimonas marina]
MTFKKSAAILTSALLSTSVYANEPQQVAQVKGTQITGISVSHDGEIFISAPNWRDGVKFAVAEVNTETNEVTPYPDNKYNRCVADSLVKDDCFLAVQSVIAHNKKLYVLDTRNPKFKTVEDAPRVFVINLQTNHVESVLTLSKEAYHADSYINDLRIDDKTQRIYMTDSNHPGLVVYNLKTNDSYRVLNEHKTTTAEVETLDIAGTPFENVIHTDGIALDRVNDTLYFHTLSGYSLYAINTKDINNTSSQKTADAVWEVAQTGAPDGMIYADNGNLFLANLEKRTIDYLTPAQELRTLVSGEKVNWADTFSIYNNDLYYTNSKIQDAGADVSQMHFEIFKVALPQ